MEAWKTIPRSAYWHAQNNGFEQRRGSQKGSVTEAMVLDSRRVMVWLATTLHGSTHGNGFTRIDSKHPPTHLISVYCPSHSVYLLHTVSEIAQLLTYPFSQTLCCLQVSNNLLLWLSSSVSRTVPVFGTRQLIFLINE